MLKRGIIWSTILVSLIFIIIGLISVTAQLGQLGTGEGEDKSITIKCYELSVEECTKYEHCQLITERKQRQRCVEKPICSQLSPPLQREGCTYTPRYDNNRCIVGYEEKCVPCPQFSPPAPEWCINGKIIPGGVDENGCQLPPKCEKISCSQLSPEECSKYEHCQLITGRKQRQRCVEKPQPTVCKIGGCSGELCGEASFIASVASPCLYKEEYACYKEFGRCERQTTGKCGWTQTEELINCIRRYQKPACGNNICEEGEAPFCPGGGIGACSRGTCPEDCKSTCGDGICEKGEDEIIGQTNSIPPSYIIKCPQDCQKYVCGNGICEESEKKCYTVCVDCAPGTPSTQCGCKEECTYTCPHDCGVKPCRDSDGGIAYYVKGYVSKGSETHSDLCTGTIDPVTNQVSGPFLREVSCTTDGSVKFGRYLCPNGCKDGACLSGTEPIIACKPGQTIGDVDGDGKITSYDANLTLQIAVELIKRPENICCVDVTQNGEISALDGTRILQIVEGTAKSPGNCGVLSCSQLSVNECTKYEHCQVVTGRKQRKRCVEMPTCPIPECAAPPAGCSYESGRDEKGCPTCGELVCEKPICGNNICEKGEASQCPPCPDPSKPCPLAPCISGTCPQDCDKPVCGNNICEEGEKICETICPSCAEGTPPEQCQCTETCTYTCPQDCQQKCAQENEFCGGIAGVTCCSGLTCKPEGYYSESGGICVTEGVCQKSISQFVTLVAKHMGTHARQRMLVLGFHVKLNVLASQNVEIVFAKMKKLEFAYRIVALNYRLP